MNLRQDLYWCDCGGRAIFLDARADRYFCLSAAANEAFLRLAAGDTQCADLSALKGLRVRGLLVGNCEQTLIPPAASYQPPTSDFLEEPLRAGAVLDIGRMLGAELSAAFLLRIGSFHQVIERASKLTSQTRTGQIHPTRLQTIVRASLAASMITRAHDRCLVRALAVHSTCRRCGIGSALVFGVRANPFSAHCWAQFESTVLVGQFEQARLYTPILVLQ